MAYKDKKEHTLELKIDVSKGSKVQNKIYKVPVIYKFPSTEEELVKNGGGYDIFTLVDGVETKIGEGGAINNDGKVSITDQDSFLKSVKALPGGNSVTDTNLNFSMANGGSDNLKKNGQEKRNSNLSPKSQGELATTFNMTPKQQEAQGLSNNVSDLNTPQTEPSAVDAASTSTSAEETTPTPLSTSALKFKTKSQQFGTALVFPQNLLDLKAQDYIKFRTYRYIPQTFKKSEFGFTEQTTKTLGTPEGTCYLPVSNGPKDANSVSWSDNKVNPLQSAAFEAAYTAIASNNLNELGGVFNKARNTLAGKNEEIKKFVATQMAQKAAGVQGMLSRTSGAILNPNMVLLFSNPELRNFSFNFELRARTRDEGQTIKRIIRLFKQSMTVRKENTNLFLLAPNVFSISYHHGTVDGNTDDHHKSIGKIKICALTNIGIDYAPDGSYMTFDDPEATMTAYSMQLQFSELEPVYYDDYAEIPADEIGF